MLYIFILRIKKNTHKKKPERKGDFMPLIGQAKLLPFDCGGGSAYKTHTDQEGTAGQAAAPQGQLMCTGSQEGKGPSESSRSMWDKSYWNKWSSLQGIQQGFLLQVTVDWKFGSSPLFQHAKTTVKL